MAHNPENKGLFDDAGLMQLKNRALDTAVEGITISDLLRPDNPIIYANAGFERLTGYEAKWVLGRNCRFLQGPETDSATAQAIRAGIQARTPVTVEILNYRRDGSTFWNRLSITPVRNEAGETTHFIGVQSDVTDRRNAEAGLRSAKENMQRNLQMAAKVQQALLPTSLPETPGARYAWRLLPCDELAGDSLNIFHLDENHIGFYLLDVSGHGVASALLSFTLRHWLSPGVNRQDADSLFSVRRVAEELNRRFPMDSAVGQYFTIVYAVLDLKDFSIRYVLAGHPPPVLISSNASARFLDFGDYPIGITQAPSFEERTVSLAAGERLYLYSDGVTEAQDSAKVFFGTDRLLDVLGRQRTCPLDESLTVVLHELTQWRNGKGFQDDVSMLAIERTA